MSVGAICSRTVYTATRKDTVRAAAERMEDHMVGTLVVVDANGRPEGISSSAAWPVGTTPRPRPWRPS